MRSFKYLRVNRLIQEGGWSGIKCELDVGGGKVEVQFPLQHCVVCILSQFQFYSSSLFVLVCCFPPVVSHPATPSWPAVTRPCPRHSPSADLFHLPISSVAYTAAIALICHQPGLNVADIILSPPEFSLLWPRTYLVDSLSGVRSASSPCLVLTFACFWANFSFHQPALNSLATGFKPVSLRSNRRIDYISFFMVAALFFSGALWSRNRKESPSMCVCVKTLRHQTASSQKKTPQGSCKGRKLGFHVFFWSSSRSSCYINTETSKHSKSSGLWEPANQSRLGLKETGVKGKRSDSRGAGARHQHKKGK